jgi:3,2-trans-enoyl-CoA isomerase
MTKGSHIGLNEVQLGIAVPKYWAQVMGRWIGEGKAEQIMFEGKLVSAEDAVKIGLVDRIVEDEKDLIPECLKKAKSLLKFPESGRVLTKKVLRESFCQEWDQYIDQQECEIVWKVLNEPKTIQSLQFVLQKLSGKSAPTKKSQAKL